MPVQPGTRIGGYEIVALLGAGGMGEVYRARDTRLGRDVAIKVLSPRIAADADAVTRFEREAKALAALNHPNIAAIYDVIEHERQPALVLELVDGDTLADRLAERPLGVEAALAMARQITDALDTAHEAGIVHRDLKPANIKITAGDQIKILDFGLAKAVAMASGHNPEFDPASTPTITVHGTQHGVILGTAAYMSPEQARGKRIDKRTDIWAFGCVLYEMLTGQRAFGGETTSDVIAAIIERQPDLSQLPAAVPPHVRDVLARCLEKDPKRRARDIADVRVELEPRPAMLPPAPRRSPVPWLAGMTVVTLAALVLAATAWRRPAAVAAPVAPIEFTVPAPPGYALTQAALPLSLSLDGRYLAFVAADEQGTQSVWVRPIDDPISRRLDGTEGTTIAPTWAPDGGSLAFFANGVWKQIRRQGGPASTIVANVTNNMGATWGPDDVLLTAPANRTALFRVAASGGSLQPVTTLDASKENSHRWPQLLPDGRHFLFTVRSDSAETLGIRLGSLDAPDVRPLVKVASPGRFVEPGWLLFVTPDQVLMAQPLAPPAWTLQGARQQVAGPIRYNGPSFAASFDASRDGRVLAYLAGSPALPTLEWFDRTGKSLGRVGPELDYRGIRLSRDGRRVAYELADPQLGTRDIWLSETAVWAASRFTSHPATDWRAVFSPDGSTLAFASDRAGPSSVLTAPATGAGPETVVLRHAQGAFPWDWSADGKTVLITSDNTQGQPGEILLQPVDGGRPLALTSNQGTFQTPALSPGGDVIAFVSEGEVFVMSIEDRQRVRVSVGGGRSPMWGRAGELFFYSAGQGLMRTVVNGGKVSAAPQPMFQPCTAVNRAFTRGMADGGIDVTADGARFLVVCDAADSTAPAINVIVNWQSRLKP